MRWLNNLFANKLMTRRQFLKNIGSLGLSGLISTLFGGNFAAVSVVPSTAIVSFSNPTGNGIPSNTAEHAAYMLAGVSHRLLQVFNPSFFNLRLNDYLRQAECYSKPERLDAFYQEDYKWIIFIRGILKENPYFEQIVSNPETARRAIIWATSYIKGWGYTEDEVKMMLEHVPELIRVSRMTPEEYEAEFKPKIQPDEQSNAQVDIKKTENPIKDFLVKNNCRVTNCSIDGATTKRLKITFLQHNFRHEHALELANLVQSQFPNSRVAFNENKVVVYNPPHSLKAILSSQESQARIAV
jgi:hypothetical protein